MTYNEQRVSSGAVSPDLLRWAEEFAGGIRGFQKFAGLEEDGLLGPRTAEEAKRVRDGGVPIPDQQRLRAVYGDFQYTELKGGAIRVDPEWARRNIQTVRLHDNKVRWLHRLVAEEFAALYKQACEVSGYTPKQVQTYVPRHTLWNPDKPLSTHSWGIAVDFDPQRNRMGGTDGVTHGPSMFRKHPEFVKVFTDAGWEWGGSWRMRDDMHIQRARL